MSYLTKEQVSRIITEIEFNVIKSFVNKNNLAIRCSNGKEYLPRVGGDGYNLGIYNYGDSTKYATAIYASVCFAQDTILDDINDYYLLLMGNCSLSSSKTYQYIEGNKSYNTLPKCQGLGPEAIVLHYWSMNNSGINLSRKLIELLLSSLRKKN